MSNIQLTHQDGITFVIFDRPHSSANIFDRATLEELETRLLEVRKEADLKGVIFLSSKPSIFIAGADLKALATADDKELAALIELGQRVFNIIASLDVPTVAAIHGACVGGGYELALACDWRVATDASSTRIGLPETQLGILPAWGGSTRLPRLIGVHRALPLILAGKVVKAKVAKLKGLVDAVVPEENLKQHAITWIGKGKHPEKQWLHLHNFLSISIIAERAKKELHKKTHGHYPGPEKAIEVVTQGVLKQIPESLQLERNAIVTLAHRPETKHLIGLYFLQERAKKHRYVEAEPRSIKATAVIGAGLMGSGIAYWLASHGHDVTLLDLDDEAIARGFKSIEKLSSDALKRKLIDPTAAARALDRIHPATGDVPLHHCDLIIEAAVENLSIKKKIFADLWRRSADHTILATNTSALPIHELSAVADGPDRLVGLHFFNPVHRMQLVEVVRTRLTSDETLATAINFVRKIGKTPVLVNDSPGFLVNRILLPYLVKAGELFDQGADPEDLDDAMLNFGMPMGPLRLLDEVGLDVALHVAQTLADAFPDRMTVPSILTTMVAEGLGGRKTGAGFYLYHKGDIKPNPAVLDMREGNKPLPSDVASQLARLMSEEAARCLDEKVAETAGDIDLSMILGTGYAPFRGGPLHYADDHNLFEHKFYGSTFP